MSLSADRMVSRAYHDSLFMAQICPTTMIFVPCRDGVSHRPDEYSTPEQIAVRVSERTVGDTHAAFEVEQCSYPAAKVL